MRRRLGTVRFRTTVAATAVVAVALAAAAVVLVVALRSSLERNLRSSAELRAADVAALVADDRLPRELPEPRGEEEGALVQVVDAGGTVVASTPEAEEGGSLAVFDLDEGERVGSRTVAGPRFDEDDDFVVVAMRAPGPGGEPHTVYVGASLEEVDATVAAARNVLLAGVPVVTLVLATTTWVVVGRALHPVEALRSEVAEITGSDLHRRVPTPEGDDEVARLARTMNGMLDRLDVASERQRRFVARSGSPAGPRPTGRRRPQRSSTSTTGRRASCATSSSWPVPTRASATLDARRWTSTTSCSPRSTASAPGPLRSSTRRASRPAACGVTPTRSGGRCATSWRTPTATLRAWSAWT